VSSVAFSRIGRPTLEQINGDVVITPEKQSSECIATKTKPRPTPTFGTKLGLQHQRINSEKEMPTKKPNAETTLVTVAESIGSALGAVAAKANKAKKALAPKMPMRRHTRKKARKSRHRAATRAFGRAARKSRRR
jgi:hypothetical protein